MMQKAIEHCAHSRHIAKQFAPVFDRSVGSEQRAAALITSHDDLQQVLGCGVRQLAHSEIVEYEQWNGRDALHVFFACSLGNGIR